MSDVSSLPLIVIVGPTASGKTALAVEVAQKFNGEVISADSRTVYKGMDIGTAKPSLEERKGVPHWGFDLVEPGERYTAFDFKRYAEHKIAEIRSRGKLPILVGGTGLYIDVVIFDYSTPEVVLDGSFRHELMKLTVDELQKYCQKNNVKLPDNSRNKRHLIRAIERKDITTSRRSEPIENTIIVGISTEKEALMQRIKSRNKIILQKGVVKETTDIISKYNIAEEAMTGNIYRLVRHFLQKEMTMDELIEKSNIADRRLAKRQMTWFRRNPHIIWGSIDVLRAYLTERLSLLNK